MDKLRALVPRPHRTRRGYGCWFFAQLPHPVLNQCAELRATEQLQGAPRVVGDKAVGAVLEQAGIAGCSLMLHSCTFKPCRT